jgi:hypothetical protein
MIIFQTPQIESNLSEDRAYSNTEYPEITWQINKYFFNRRGDTFIVATYESGGIFVTLGDINGWDDSTRQVVATPNITNPSYIFGNITACLRDDEVTWVAAWTFGPANEDLESVDLEVFYKQKGDVLDSKIGQGLYVAAYSPKHFEEAYIFFLRSDGIYQVTDDNFLAISLTFKVESNVIPFEVFQTVDYRTQIKFLPEFTYWIDIDKNTGLWTKVPKAT